MPTATVTVRELKNKETNIDLSIPTTKEIPSLLSSNTEYHVVVVTSFKCFKSAKHKDTDVVQFMIPKQLNDFNVYHEKLSTAFPGTLFPTIPKKMAGIIIGSSSQANRKLQLETFLNFVSTTPKTCFHYITLEFLGASKLAAQTYINSLSSEDKSKAAQADIQDENKVEEESPKKSLFGGGDEEGEEELFGGASSSNQVEKGQLFSESPAKQRTKTAEPSRLFEEQDLGGGVTSGENEDLFFVPGAKDTKANKSKIQLEDNSDLLNIEDDLDKLLKVEKKINPPVAKKPVPKPKPPVAAKPGAKKPPPPPKPARAKPKKAKSPDLFGKSDDGAMDTDDIMKYIQANTDKQDSDLNLF